MAELSRAALFGEPSRVAYRPIESSAAFGQARGHARVKWVPWLHPASRHDDPELYRIAHFAGIEVTALMRESADALASTPSRDGQPIGFHCAVER